MFSDVASHETKYNDRSPILCVCDGEKNKKKNSENLFPRNKESEEMLGFLILFYCVPPQH